MLKAVDDPNNNLRYTHSEITSAREIGLDLSDVTSIKELGYALEMMLEALPNDESGYKAIRMLFEASKTESPELHEKWHTHLQRFDIRLVK